MIARPRPGPPVSPRLFENRPKEVQFLKARSLATFRLFNSRHGNYRDLFLGRRPALPALLAPRLRDCWERFETAARAAHQAANRTREALAALAPSCAGQHKPQGRRAVVGTADRPQEQSSRCSRSSSPAYPPRRVPPAWNCFIQLSTDDT